MAATDDEQAKVFVLCINLKFQTVPDRDEFLEIWRPLGAYVQVNEEGTLSYECLVADTDELLVLVFERYVNKRYFNDIHRTSAPYLAFKAQQATWRADKQVEVSGQSYFETGIGHMTR